MLALCDEFGFEDLRTECEEIIRSKPHVDPNTDRDHTPIVKANILEERISRHELEVAAVHTEIASLRKSI
jgi:hypothetical protein